MQTTYLAGTDMQVSRLCLGSMMWGSQVNQEGAHAQIDYALDQGINFLDTSEMYAVPPVKETYGATETIIGNWFESNQGRRGDVILASKITPELPHIRGGAPVDRPNILKALDASLKRLKTDYIDIYQIHWPSNRNTYHFHNYWGYTPRVTDKAAILANKLEILKTMDELIKAGKIRAFGLSNDSAWGISQFCHLAEENKLTKPASVQNEYSLICRRDDTDVAEAVMIEGLSYLAWSPNGMGLLSGKYLNGREPENARLTFSETAKARYQYRLSDNAAKAASLYVELAKSIDLDPTQLAIAYTLARPFVACPIFGASTMDQLKSNIKADAAVLSKETLSQIDAINKQHPLPF